MPAAPTQLTHADNGKTINLSVGQDVQVQLDAVHMEGATLTFGEPTSSDEAVLAPEGERRSGKFKAAAEGTTDITAEATCTEDDEMADQKMCPEDGNWKVTVNVSS